MLWLEDILLWLEDRLEDIPFSSLSSSLYCVHSQSVAPILEDMADFFACRVIMHVIASLLFGVLSVFLTIFLAYDDAQVRKIQLLPDFDKMINDVEKEVEEQQAEDGLVNHIPDLKQLSEDIDKTTNTFINVALELESAIQQYQRAEAQLGGAVTTISKKVDTINQHIDKVLENAPTKLKVSVNVNDADWQKIQELFAKERQWMTAQMQTHIREVNSMFADERKKVAK